MSFRSAATATSGWVFGLAVTVMLISLWGRAVVVDTDALADAAAPLSGSATVIEMFTDWLTGEFVDNGIDTGLAAPIVDNVMETPSVANSLDEVMTAVVEAAAASTTSGSTVDVGSLLAPAAPEISNTLSAAGLSVSEDDVLDVVTDLDPLVIRQDQAAPYVGPESPAASRLGTAGVMALVVMMVSGWIAVGASKEPTVELRRLLTRVALGGLSFGILLRLGSWILDPGGGRAPVSESLSSLAGAKWLVPVAVAIVAALMAAAIKALSGWFKREGEFQSSDERPTRELELELSHPG